MDTININKLLGREQEVKNMKNPLLKKPYCFGG